MSQFVLAENQATAIRREFNYGDGRQHMKPVCFPDLIQPDTAWYDLLNTLVEQGVVTWKEIAALTLGHLNPSQVGTSMASADGFKRRYGKGHTMEMVIKWLYAQDGICADCGTRLELQADHRKPKEDFADPLDADFIENMELRCRRCNVVRRKSHVFGGQTNLTAEAALQWLLFTYRPRTLQDFVRLCRLYGMTMADIRMAEGWAMAHWMANDAKFDYEIEDADSDQLSDILLWTNDGAVTRKWLSDLVEEGPHAVLHSGVRSRSSFWFFAASPANSDPGKMRIQGFRCPVSYIPFSHYKINDCDPQALAIRYVPPNRQTDPPQPHAFKPLPPRGMTLLASDVRNSSLPLTVKVRSGTFSRTYELPPNFGTRKLVDLDQAVFQRLKIEIV